MSLVCHSASLLICQVMLQQNQVPDSGLLELEVGAIGLWKQRISLDLRVCCLLLFIFVCSVLKTVHKFTFMMWQKIKQPVLSHTPKALRILLAYMLCSVCYRKDFPLFSYFLNVGISDLDRTSSLSLALESFCCHGCFVLWYSSHFRSRQLKSF